MLIFGPGRGPHITVLFRLSLLRTQDNLPMVRNRSCTDGKFLRIKFFVFRKIKVVEKKSFHEDTWGSYANNYKLRSEGWTPKVNLKLGAELTIKHVAKNKLF